MSMMRMHMHSIDNNHNHINKPNSIVVHSCPLFRPTFLLSSLPHASTRRFPFSKVRLRFCSEDGQVFIPVRTLHPRLLSSHSQLSHILASNPSPILTYSVLPILLALNQLIYWVNIENVQLPMTPNAIALVLETTSLRWSSASACIVESLTVRQTKNMINLTTENDTITNKIGLIPFHKSIEVYRWSSALKLTLACQKCLGNS